MTTIINKAVAFASRRIPYIPELRAHCKSVNACILMTQLEYRFASMPNGFYKFLSPCEHYAYKLKDSWTEELGFSEEEFRTAIGHIATRYPSKTQYQEAIETGQDPFLGKCYLVYRDVVNGLTYYLRNHEVANAVMDDAVSRYQPELEQESPQACFDRTRETGNTHALKSGKPVSGEGDSPFPLIGKHKKTSKDDNSSSHNTTKIGSAHLGSCGGDFYAAAELSGADLVIQAELSDKQMVRINQLAQSYAEKYKMDKANMVAHIITTMCDPESFSIAGKDFLKKINTLNKVMKEGKWTPPASVALQTDKKQRRRMADLQAKILDIKSKISGAEQAINFGLKAPEQISYWEKIKETSHQALHQYEHELALCNNHGLSQAS